MTGRQRVIAALAGVQSDRTPFAWGFGPTPPLRAKLAEWARRRGFDWSRLQFSVSDTLVFDAEYCGPPLAPGQPTYVGVWGIETTPVSYGAGYYDEFTSHPLADVTRVEQLAQVRWPSADWFDYGALPQMLLERDPQHDKAWQVSVMTGGNPLEIYTWMTGMETAMTNLIENPDLVRAALDRICSYFEHRLERTADVLGAMVDLVHIGDDLGTQTQLLISRATYRSVVQAFHRRLVDHARRVLPGAKLIFHSDGAVFSILPDVIEAGIDALEAVQTDAQGMDAERLKATFGERLSFHGGISVQSLLPRADAAAVRDECKRLACVFGRGGRYIAAPTHAIQANTPVENVWAMLEGIVGDDLDAIVSAVRA